jgi:muconate cycloisomerase/chloromuconate cycloisomerase
MSGTLNWSGEDGVGAQQLIMREIAPKLMGRSPSQVIEINRELEEKIHGNSFTRASINMALWDAFGKLTNLPVYELLGGKRRDRIAVKISISGDGEELRSGIEAAKASGFDSFKVKVGHGRSRDIPRFQLAREILGNEAFLAVDANCGWSFEEARYCIDAFKGLGVSFIEQPLNRNDLEGMKKLRSFEIPIVADESIFSLEDARRCLAADAADGVSIYVGKSGSLNRALEIGELFAEKGKSLVIGSNAELGIGTAAQIHLGAALSTIGEFPSDIIGQHFYSEGTLLQENRIDGKFAYVTDTPGLGVTPRHDLIEALK